MRTTRLLLLTLMILTPTPLLADPAKDKATVYRDPNCGCCGAHAAYLRQHGYDVTIMPKADLTPIKRRYAVPNNLLSCHTTVIGNYAIEGHVPIASIEKLLRERPKVRGIALPAMPSGSPGMPGSKDEVFTIYSFSDGRTQIFAIE
jgi:hypothetical protein